VLPIVTDGVPWSVCLSVGTTVAVLKRRGVRTRVSPGYHVLDGGADHPKGGSSFGGGVSWLAVYSNL